MGQENWSVESLPAFQKKDEQEVDWLWSASLPPNRDNNPVRLNCLRSYVGLPSATPLASSAADSNCEMSYFLYGFLPCTSFEQAAWETIIGFFEDAITASCSRPGKLVVTPVRNLYSPILPVFVKWKRWKWPKRHRPYQKCMRKVYGSLTQTPGFVTWQFCSKCPW